MTFDPTIFNQRFFGALAGGHDTLKPIYSCSSTHEMEALLAKRSDALRTAIGAGSAVWLACDNARFVTDIGAVPRHRADVCIECDAASRCAAPRG